MENEIVKSIDREKIKAEVINQVIALSEKEIGYHEKGINITKYAQRDFPGFQGENWCNMFIGSMFIDAYGRSDARKVLGVIAPGTMTTSEKFKADKRWHNSNSGYTPQAGDIIYFKVGPNKNPIDHVGIVTKVENGKVYTIEGNTRTDRTVERNGVKVANKEYPINSKFIVGYGTPNWDILVDKEVERIKSESVDTGQVNFREVSSSLSSRARKLAQQCEDRLVEYCNEHKITATEPSDFKNISMALTNNAIKAGMSKVESLTIDDNWKVSVFSHEPDLRYASVMATEAVKIPAERSVIDIQNLEQELAQQRNQLAYNQQQQQIR